MKIYVDGKEITQQEFLNNMNTILQKYYQMDSKRKLQMQ